MKKEEALLVSEPEAAIANHKASFFPPGPEKHDTWKGKTLACQRTKKAGIFCEQLTVQRLDFLIPD